MEIGREKSLCLVILAPCSHWQLKPALALRKLCGPMGGFEEYSSSKMFRGFKLDW